MKNCLDLLRLEKEPDIQRNLAHGLLSHFATEGIEATRELLISQELDWSLRHYLLETCTIMGERFPEFDEWMKREKVEAAETWKKITELQA